MSFDKRPSYDDEEYAPAEAYAPAPAAEWDDEEEAYDDEEFAAAPPPPPPPRRAAARPAAPPPARSPRRVEPPPARGARRVSPPARQGGRTPKGVRVSASRPAAAGRPRWLIPAVLVLLAILLVGGGSVFLAPPAAPPLPPAAAATVAAQSTALAPVVGGTQVSTNGPPGVAATVNGKPITVAAWQERLQAAEQQYGDQFHLDFGGDVGKRMVDVLSFDVLDEMINFEVLMQQAKKDNLIPNPTQVQDRYNQIQTQTAQSNQSWPDFLASQHMSDQEFRQQIVDAFTYLVIADQHTQQATSDTAKAQALADYICSTRTNYDVQVYVNFIVPQQPCSSAQELPGGPPANLTIPAGGTVPTPVETGGPPSLTPQQ